jgi:isoamylase
MWRMASSAGRPGVTLVEGGVHFCVYAGRATAMDLCLFAGGASGEEVARVRMERDGDLWHATVGGVGPGQHYGYRAHGDWSPGEGLRYHAGMVLLDPYARAVVGEAAWRDALQAEDWKGGRRELNNAPEAFRSVVVDPGFDWGGDQRPRRAWEDTIIYELHVRGFTRRMPGLDEALRGTYAGLANEVVIDYLKGLGVTAVQLLPVHQHLDDRFLVERGLENFWGYNSIGFFAPHHGYALADDPQEQVREFKGMVKALHAAGIEIILDVVYNHTGEGGEGGPTISFRGLDNPGYYRLEGRNRAHYWDSTGTGATVDVGQLRVMQLVMDSLRYWVEEMHVDGFRFDLGVAVGRWRGAFHADGPFFQAVAQDPVLAGVKMIAEPWDVGQLDSYQVGGFAPPWRELNGKYRDVARRFWRGDAGVTAEFQTRLAGSQDLYGRVGRGPLASVNFLTSHDGFPLRDLASYSRKHNQANGEGNRDGDSENHSLNFGSEGVQPGWRRVEAVRRRYVRSMLASLLVSKGVPFLLAGDERLRTQGGNNNAYCQDNEISWVDWRADGHVENLLAFTRRLLALRRELVQVRGKEFYHGKASPDNGMRDVVWLGEDGHELGKKGAEDGFGMLLGEHPAVLILFNRRRKASWFTLPGGDGEEWEMVLDTAHERGGDEGVERRVAVAGRFRMRAISVVVLRMAGRAAGPIAEAMGDKASPAEN